MNWFSFDNSARLRKIRQRRQAQAQRIHQHTWVTATRHCDAPGTRHLCTTCGITRRDT